MRRCSSRRVKLCTLLFSINCSKQKKRKEKKFLMHGFDFRQMKRECVEEKRAKAEEREYSANHTTKTNKEEA